jgi:hypothetical protein
MLHLTVEGSKFVLVYTFSRWAQIVCKIFWPKHLLISMFSASFSKKRFEIGGNSFKSLIEKQNFARNGS